jgi:hypothetical protein
MSRDSTNTRRKISPGDGERQALRGYTRQYNLAARLIYKALAAGRLAWIGLADRSAGTFDDIVLGLSDGSIEGYQLKTSLNPEPFGIDTLLLGGPAVLDELMSSRRQLRADNTLSEVRTIFACDDYPRVDDRIGGLGRAGSSAAFLSTLIAERDSWSLADWRRSRFASFIAKLQARAGLEDTEFLEALRGMRFITGGEERAEGHRVGSASEARRVGEIADLLPHLVAGASQKDRWPLGELLQELGWRDAFDLRHSHQFPVDEFVQRNVETETALQAALATAMSGYISLLGPPGAGKSTLLQSGLLPTPQAAIIRYLAFLPGEGHGLGRAEAFDFLSDVIRQFKLGGLCETVVPAEDLPELRMQLVAAMAAASRRYAATGVRTIIVVDGLDHVPREEKPDRSLLSELPLPQSVPQGVIFVLGSQRLGPRWNAAGCCRGLQLGHSQGNRCAIATRRRPPVGGPCRVASGRRARPAFRAKRRKSPGDALRPRSAAPRGNRGGSRRVARFWPHLWR